MRATIEFNLDSTEDEERLRRCMASTDMALVLFHFVFNSRKDIEHEVESAQLSPAETINYIYTTFSNLLEKHHIDIENLIT